jgi:ankyrin repeat protein
VDTRLQSSLLLKRGADVESEYEASRTPLSYAAERGHKAVVELLLEDGADIGSKDDEGQTSLFWSSRYRRDAVVELFLEKGADSVQRQQWPDIVIVDRVVWIWDNRRAVKLLLRDSVFILNIPNS